MRWPLPVCARKREGAACSKSLDPLGDHRAACALSGRLKRRSAPLERTWARIFREAGARVVNNFFLRDTSLPGIAADDGRRLEVLATGLPFFRGTPLGVDATLVSASHADGTPWAGAAAADGVAIRRAEAAKRRTYPELVNSSVIRLVTVACEVGGRWNHATQELLRGLAGARARAAPPALQATAKAAWARRWSSHLSLAVQSALAATLVDDVPVELDGADAEAPCDVAVRDDAPA